RINGQAVQPLYTFGKIDTGKAAARHLVRAAKHQKTVAQAEVVVNVNRAFWAFQLTQAFLTSLDAGKQTLASVLDKIEELLEADSTQVTENDRLRLKYALSTLDVRAAEANQAARSALRAMRLLLGWPQHRELTIEKRDLDEIPDEAPSLQSGLRAAASQRPDLLAIDAVVDAANTFADFRRAGFYPSLFIGGFLDYAFTSNATNQTNPFIHDPFNFFTMAAGLGLRVELDIFTKLALLEQAEAQARVRAQQAALAVQAVQLEVHNKHIEINGGYQRIDALEKANRTARGWLTASALAYDIGTGRADELIDAFLAWAASEAELQTTRFNTLLNLVDFARATGRLMEAYRTRKP
ncbi:MAG: TolC family protein, partial [Myxococcota bacterium]